MAKLFGFKVEDLEVDKKSKIISPVPKNDEDKSDFYVTSGFYGQYVDIEGVYKNEFDLVKRYREMSLHPECDSAIEDVVNEAIVSDLNDSPVEIDLSNLPATDKLKEAIRKEFKYIKEIMDFDKKCHEIFRNWYVDGKIYYHKVIDLKKPSDGIKEIRYIDPLKIKYIRKIKKPAARNNLESQMKSIFDKNENNFDLLTPKIDEFYLYDPMLRNPSNSAYNSLQQSSQNTVKMTKDSITCVTSGLVDRNRQTVLSYLHKAIKALNQLRMIEDSLVIYRLCLVGNSRVKTKTGYSYIKDINIGDVVYTYDNRIQKLVETQVSNKWMTGIKQTFKVSSKHHNIIGTDTHPILVYDSTSNEVKYIPIKNLIPKKHYLTYVKPEESNTITLFPEIRRKASFIKDSLFWSSYKLQGKEKKIEEISSLTNIKGSRIRNFLYGNQALENESVKLLEEQLPALKQVEYGEKYEGYCSNELNLPSQITPEFARMFGFLIGDGSISKYGVTFAEGENEVQNQYYSKLMEKFFGNCRRISSNRKYSNYTSSNTLASELLSQLGFVNGSKEKRIPNWVFTSNNQIKYEFILGILDADGHYRDLVEGFSCEISLANQRLIEDIKEVWTSLGLCSGQIRHRIRPESTRVIGEEETPRTMPQTECWELYLSEYELPRFEKIYKIETAEIEEVYDIEVDHEKHNFVANGIVVHNSRAPERRLFYIDVGNLPKIKAEQYMRDVMNRYRNKLIFDSTTGEIKDDRKYMAMLEDYWLPRREGGRGTEVTTLPGGQNLGELSDIEYFQKKLYKSLGVPSTRLDAGGGFNLGRSSEILRDELKFSRFVGRLRKRFSYLFVDMLKSQLILKNIVSPDDWERLEDHIQFDYLYDNHFSDLKKNEILNDKIAVVGAMEPYIGKYFSVEYIRKNILKQSDEEIIEIDMQIQQEMEAGIIPPPMQPGEEMGTEGGQMGGAPQANTDTLGKPMQEPGVSTANVEAGEI